MSNYNDNQDGVWRTIKGSKVFIPTGQTPAEAFENSKKISKVFDNYKHLGYIEIDKSYYKRLADIIGTYPKKYRVGGHVINLDNVFYLVNVERRDFFGVYDSCPIDIFDDLMELYSSV